MYYDAVAKIPIHLRYLIDPESVELLCGGPRDITFCYKTLMKLPNEGWRQYNPHHHTLAELMEQLGVL